GAEIGELAHAARSRAHARQVEDAKLREGGRTGNGGHGPDSKPAGAASMLRQRNEFAFAGHLREALFAPALFRLFEALLRAGDVIPPDETRPIHFVAAEQHDAGPGFCPNFYFLIL